MSINPINPVPEPINPIVNPLPEHVTPSVKEFPININPAEAKKILESANSYIDEVSSGKSIGNPFQEIINKIIPDFEAIAKSPNLPEGVKENIGNVITSLKNGDMEGVKNGLTEAINLLK